MARLFAFIGNRADLGGRVVEAHRSLFLAQRNDATALGWGVGLYQSGEALLRRRPVDDRAEVDSSAGAAGARTDLLVSHIRRPTVGALRTENTQPFRYRSWLFASLGTALGSPEASAMLRAEIPDFLRRDIRGDSDAELLFYRFLLGLHQRGNLLDLGASATAIGEALVETLVRTDEAQAGNRGAEPPLVLLATNGECIVVAHRAEPFATKVLAGATQAEALLPDQDTYPMHLTDLQATRFSLLAAGYAEVPDGFDEERAASLVTLTRESPPRVETL